MEDDDMYYRIYAVFDRLVRLPQEVGSYKALEHDRASEDVHRASDEFKASQAHLNQMKGDIVEARNQMASDGLNQVCLHGEFLHIERDPSRRLMILTSDLFDTSPCMESKPNTTKKELEDRHRSSGRSECCVSTLQDARLQPKIIPRIRVCTAHDVFCVKLWSGQEILDKTIFFDQVAPTRRERETSNPTLRPTGVSTACEDYDQMTSAKRRDIAGFLGLVGFGRLVDGDTDEVKNLHGDNHPAISITWGHPALVYQYDSDGALLSMEFNGWLGGCVANFEYNLLVLHVTSDTWRDNNKQWVWTKNVYERNFKLL